MTTTDIPLPKDPRHQRFADLHVFRGMSGTEAYIAAGFKVSRSTAASNAPRLIRRPDVQAYIAAIRAAAVDETVLTTSEILRFSARLVRAKLGDLTPDGPDGDLLKSYSSSETEMGTTVRAEKHDPFKAIETHLKLTGNDPGTAALQSLAEALQSLAPASPIPTGKL
jgi:phage terminase small subunit